MTYVSDGDNGLYTDGFGFIAYLILSRFLRMCLRVRKIGVADVIAQRYYCTVLSQSVERIKRCCPVCLTAL